jgi:lipoprotein-anchoring transpeptidase ErfK/SrfK
MVNVSLGYPPGTIVIDTASKYLYLVLNGGKAMRYGIGVGRQGFSWAGTATIRRKAKWPTWTPPAAMVARDEFAAKWAGGMPGGPANPLGARALYLYKGNRDTLYRIHGTIVPSSIGKAVSSGCIRMLNADVADLYERVPVGTKVVVLQGRSPFVAEDVPPAKRKRKFLFE